MAAINYLNVGGPIPIWITGVQAFSSLALDASGDRYASAFIMPEAATITHVGFRYALRTGTPPTYLASLQSPDASGLPDGTPVGGGSPASVTFTPPADATWDATWQWVQLDNAYAAARGERLCLVINHSSGTINGSHNSTFSRYEAGWTSGRPGIPYNLSDTTGSWAKTSSAVNNPLYAVKSASRVYGFPMQSAVATTVSSSGNRAAKKFTLPGGSGDTFKVVGLRFVAQGPATGNDWIVGIWNAAGTAQQAITLDGDFLISVANAQRICEVYFDDTPVTLNFGTTYYYGIERVNSNVILYSIGLPSTNELTAFSCGTISALSTWDGATWSDTDTALPLVELILEDITEPAASGGSTRVIGG